MKLPLTSAAVDHLDVLSEIGSTNAELLARASNRFEPDFSVLVTDSQTAGRGRLDRVWVAPAGRSLAISVLLRPVDSNGKPVPIERFGWLPLMAGVAMTNAVQSLVPGRASLKWPNDVQINGLKVSGLLAELLPTSDAIVMGAGVNTSMTETDLPTPTSTSLTLSGAVLDGDELSDALLSEYLSALRALYGDFVRLGADAEASGISQLLAELCSTLGQRVRVQLPGGDDLTGVAVGIDSTGRLEVRQPSDGRVVAVAAGDVTHLRYE
jgi:BirA family transcriptional regulator, biotin operon repressor / biotin---[acetyl-CoA-carboxylase] ligase